MRVISGTYRGCVLKGPKHEGLRPTADRVKEALFNIIGAKIHDSDFLDLFAGTGSIGIEALSRGARSAIFADNNHLSIKLLHENLKIIKSGESIRVLQSDAAKALNILAGEQLFFDLIFLDPPFESELFSIIPSMIVQLKLLKKDGYLIIEHPSRLAVTVPELEVIKDRKYGDISLTFFQYANTDKL